MRKMVGIIWAAVIGLAVIAILVIVLIAHFNPPSKSVNHSIPLPSASPSKVPGSTILVCQMTAAGVIEKCVQTQ